ncbi:MAG: hypothetical protein LBP61_03280 [Desulfovibrio sp.]|nr:hypothetical protein [Desulfovibrio sp.]
MKAGRLLSSLGEKVPKLFRSAPEGKAADRPAGHPGSGAGGTLLKRLRLRVPSGEGAQRGVLLVLIVSVMGCVALGLTLVWLNTERTRLALRAHALQKEADARQELRAKLEVEHASLVSPDVLMKKAAALGLRAALPGEIRRMERDPSPEPDSGGK